MENSINSFFGKQNSRSRCRQSGRYNHTEPPRCLHQGLPDQIQMRLSLNEEMKSKLTSDPSLASSLIPSWSVGCRRFTPGPGYLEALQAPNVRIILSGVTRITPTVCISADGQSHTFDALICATGFNTSFTPRFPVVNNATGHSLQDEWATDPRGYLSTAAAGFPNYLTLFGPNSPTGNGPVLPAMEKQADYILRLVDRYQTENMHAFAPKCEAVDDFNAYVDWFMARTVWSDDCRSWYKKHSADGRITGLWPGSALHFHEAIREVRWDDWEVRYVGNRFAWLGNGFSQLEMDPEGDLSWYIGERDDAEHGSRRKRRRVLIGRREEPGKAKL
ncbi:hypothetical protein MPH_09113 [Macrophomina phaseolina MS6]|uniref:Uncharacterized protein n=1 Tax=Macrophomina phaseolina (strain MS6) TaxID=1126212 RepID=K2RGB4_MACPH|nr:hypothetical protein MPH_09113 [Macrophomina phaseolina MS6]